MKVVTLVTQKGGSGKSTLVASLAVAAEQSGQRVFLLDLDPQGTLKRWVERREADTPGFDTVADSKALAAALTELDREGYGVVILDTAGTDSPLVTAAIAAASLCLVPARPTIADLEATQPTISAIQALRRSFAFILNQTPVQGSRRVNEAKAGLRVMGLLAEPPIGLRNDHQDAMGLGLGVTEYDPQGKAADELRALWSWINNRMKD